MHKADQDDKTNPSKNGEQGEDKNQLTEKCMAKGGLRQGDPLSSLFFNLLLEKIMQEADINRSGLIYHKKHQCLAFRDDIVIVTRN